MLMNSKHKQSTVSGGALVEWATMARLSGGLDKVFRTLTDIWYSSDGRRRDRQLSGGKLLMMSFMLTSSVDRNSATGRQGKTITAIPWTRKIENADFVRITIAS